MRVVVLGKPEVATPIEELSGNMSQQDEQKLMNSVMEGDKTDDAKIVLNALNHGIFSFNPDQMFEQLVQNYQEAEKLYGEGFLRYVDASERDMRFPEVQRNVKEKIREKLGELQQSGFIGEDMEVTEKGIAFASLTLYMEELDQLQAKGLLGEKFHKRSSHYGEKIDVKKYQRGDRYKDLALKRSIKQAIRHHHSQLAEEDLQVFRRESKGAIHMIYGLDASGSMKGKKVETCKKAGVALAFKAIQEHDKVGLIVFGSEVQDTIAPTSDFLQLLHAMTKIRAKNKTNMRDTILKSIELFSNEDVTKHLILITDAVPTEGADPRKETLNAAEQAKHAGVTISLIGINLDKEGESLAQEVTAIGGGKLYSLKQLEDLDRVVLMDYYAQGQKLF